MKYANIEEWRQYILELRNTQKYVYDKHINMKTFASSYYFIDRLKNYCDNLPVITSDGSAHVVTLQGLKLKENQKTIYKCWLC
jgi:hypothetical protein